MAITHLLLDSDSAEADVTGGRSSLDELVLDWYEDGAGERSDDEDAATACEACGWDCKDKNDDY